jgi:hypothetical protein
MIESSVGRANSCDCRIEPDEFFMVRVAAIKAGRCGRRDTRGWIEPADNCRHP